MTDPLIVEAQLAARDKEIERLSAENSDLLGAIEIYKAEMNRYMAMYRAQRAQALTEQGESDHPRKGYSGPMGQSL